MTATALNQVIPGWPEAFESDRLDRDLLARAVHLNVSPDLSAAQVEEVAEALSKVLGAI